MQFSVITVTFLCHFIGTVLLCTCNIDCFTNMPVYMLCIWRAFRSQCNISSYVIFCCLCFICLFIRRFLPSLFWHCWLGVRKSVRPVNIDWWGVGVVICLERGAECLHVVQLMPLLSQNPIIACLIKSRLVLPLWYRLTQVFLEKRPLNGCSS